jgi:hypothetical protein
MASIDERDYQVLQTIAQFKQVTAHHVHKLLFSDALSMYPCYRALNRLYKRNHLHRLEHRLIGGVRGGSSQYVWTLGYEAWRMFSDSPYRVPRSINFHTLEIANTYLRLVELERVGRLRIGAYTTEPDCWFTVDSYEVKPDLYVETVLTSGLVKTFCEIDLGSEGEKQVKGKLAAYIHAFNHVDAEQFPIWPRTLWIAVDANRAQQLRRFIGQLREDDRKLFKVCDKSSLPDMFK